MPCTTMEVDDLVSLARGDFLWTGSFMRDGQKVELHGEGGKCQADRSVCAEVL